MPTQFTDAQLNDALRFKHLRSLVQRTKAVTDNLQSQINSLGNDAIKTVKVNGTALTATGNAVDILATMEKLTTAESGYASSYQLKINNVAVGDKINVAKDWLLTGTTLETSTEQNYETIGTSAAGKKYIDFAFNVKANGDGGTETTTHIYLPVEDLVDVYRDGNGLQLDANNTFSIKIDSTSVGGLTVGANGLKLAEATPDTYSNGTKTADGVGGAMSSADKYKLNGISEGATKTEVETEKAGTIKIDGTTKVIVEFASDTDVATMLDEELPAPSAGE